MNIQELGFDPYTCSLDELEEQIKYYNNLSASENDFQMAVKLFINSVYGCLGCRYYNLYNPDIAEAITLQGQDLIKYSAERIDKFAIDCWPHDTQAHQQIANYMKERFPDFDNKQFEELAKHPIKFDNTLQIGGDSVIGSSIIRTTSGNYTIEELFNMCSSDRNTAKKVYAKSDKIVYNVDKNNNIITSHIKYIIRHKTNKSRWILESNGHHVIATSDHSFIIMRDNIRMDVKPSDILPSDKIIFYIDGKSVLCNIDKIYQDGNFSNEYVYDIEIETDDINAHNFFANDILVHNTDSVSGNSIIITEKHKDGISIEKLYEENNVDSCTDINGHELVSTKDRVLNWDGNLYFGDVKRIIRHKVSKRKWRLTTKTGKIVECTDDHSLIVFRNGKKLEVKPYEILQSDKILTLKSDKR